jgi:hypothetical protein
MTLPLDASSATTVAEVLTNADAGGERRATRRFPGSTPARSAHASSDGASPTQPRTVPSTWESQLGRVIDCRF